MRRGPVRFTAVVVALFVATLTAGATTTAASVSAWSTLETASVNEDNVIPAGWPSYYQAKQCAWQGSCPELEDVAFHDVDISDTMEGYENGTVFEVTNGVVTPIASWFVCSFDDTGRILDCWRGSGSGGLRGELSEDARELRLMPLRSAVNEYHLRLYTW
jgi:hypothetical protein